MIPSQHSAPRRAPPAPGASVGATPQRRPTRAADALANLIAEQFSLSRAPIFSSISSGLFTGCVRSCAATTRTHPGSLLGARSPVAPASLACLLTSCGAAMAVPAQDCQGMRTQDTPANVDTQAEMRKNRPVRDALSVNLNRVVDGSNQSVS
jgi:hypothetical protein